VLPEPRRPGPTAPAAGHPLRVAVVAETFVPAVNGVVGSVLRAADHLALRGHTPVVVAPSGSSYGSRCGARRIGDELIGHLHAVLAARASPVPDRGQPVGTQ